MLRFPSARLRPFLRSGALRVLLLAVVAAGCAGSPARGTAPGTPAQPAVRITILHTNDHHGHAWPWDDGGCPAVGGLAVQATVVRRVRAEVEAAGGHVLLLSAGDVNTGVAASDLLGARPDFDAMGLIGYDAMTCGNHEFDDPGEWERQLAEAPFAMLCANVLRRADGSVAGRTHVTLTRGGIRIAVLGVLSGDAPHESNPDLWRTTYEIRDPIEVATALAARLRPTHEVVVGLVHLGFHPEPEIEARRPGSRTLAVRSPDLDLLVDGHTHTLLREAVHEGGTMIVQAGNYGRHLGRVDLLVRGGRVVESRYRVIPLNAADPLTGACPEARIPGAQDVAERLAGYRVQLEARLAAPIAEALVRLDGAGLARRRETNLGNLVADAIRAAADAEVGLVNGGAIRESLEPGPVTWGDVQGVCPFANTIVRFVASGRLLLRILERSARADSDDGGFLQVSGLRYVIDDGRPTDVEIGGEALDPERRYVVATTSFLVAGGDGYDMLTAAEGVADSMLTYADVVRRFMRGLGRISYETEGRIRRR